MLWVQGLGLQCLGFTVSALSYTTTTNRRTQGNLNKQLQLRVSTGHQGHPQSRGMGCYALSLSRSLHANKRSTPYLRSILLNSVYRRPTQGKQSRLGYLGSSYLLKFEITVVGWASDVGGLVAPLVQNPRLRVAVLSQNAITPIPTATTPQCPTYPR